MSELSLAVERIAPLVLRIRHEKVLLDFHLAELYGVETRALKQAVRRNRGRFPADFMFELSEQEEKDLVSQNVIPRRGQLGRGGDDTVLTHLPSKASRCGSQTPIAGPDRHHSRKNRARRNRARLQRGLPPVKLVKSFRQPVAG